MAMRVQEETVQVQQAPGNGQQAAALIQQDVRNMNLAMAHQYGMIMAAAAQHMIQPAQLLAFADRNMQPQDSNFCVGHTLTITCEFGGDR